MRFVGAVWTAAGDDETVGWLATVSGVVSGALVVVSDAGSGSTTGITALGTSPAEGVGSAVWGVGSTAACGSAGSGSGTAESSADVTAASAAAAASVSVGTATSIPVASATAAIGSATAVPSSAAAFAGRMTAGALAKAARADFVVLDDASPVLAGRALEDVIDTFVFAGNANLVRDVYVGGERVVAEFRHRDRERIAARYRDVVERLIRR